MSSPRFSGGPGSSNLCESRPPVLISTGPPGPIQGGTSTTSGPLPGLTTLGHCPLGHPMMPDPCTGQVLCACHMTPPLPHPQAAPGGLPHPSLASAFYPRLESLCGTATAASKAELLRGSLPGTFPASCPLDPYTVYPYLSSYAGIDARRKNSMKEATNTLKAWLYEHRKNPYPTKGEKIMLAIITKMTLTQVSTWFANARRRLKKENKMTWGVDKEEEGEDDEEGTGEGKSPDEVDLDLDDKENYEDEIEEDDDERTLDVELLPDSPSTSQGVGGHSTLSTDTKVTQVNLSRLGPSDMRTQEYPSPHHIQSSPGTRFPSANISPSRSSHSPSHDHSFGRDPSLQSSSGMTSRHVSPTVTSHQPHARGTSSEGHALKHPESPQRVTVPSHQDSRQPLYQRSHSSSSHQESPPSRVISVPRESGQVISQRSPSHEGGGSPNKADSTGITSKPVQKPRIWSIADVVSSDSNKPRNEDASPGEQSPAKVSSRSPVSVHAPSASVSTHAHGISVSTRTLPPTGVPHSNRMYSHEESRYVGHAQLMSGLASSAPYHMYAGYMAGIGGPGLQAPCPTLLPGGYWKAS